MKIHQVFFLVSLTVSNVSTLTCGLCWMSSSSPVCGNNNTTYSNGCYLQCSGQKVKHNGNCKSSSSEYKTVEESSSSSESTKSDSNCTETEES